MALIPQSIPINFSQGLDTKTDPKQVSIGRFLSLQNGIFDELGALKKRNGFGSLSSLPNSASYLTTFNGALTAIGSTLQAYSPSSTPWVTTGNIQPLKMVQPLPLIRNSLNQTQCDAAVTSAGLVCTVYTESNGSTISYKYAIADSTTGQVIVQPTVIPVTSGTVTGSPRVFVLGNYFIVAFTNQISAAFHLQYIAINLANPQITTTNADIASSYIPATTLSWDGFVVGSNLYVAYNTTSGGQAVNVTYLSAASAANGGSAQTPKNFSGSISTIMSVCADQTIPQSPIIWATFYDSASSTMFSLAVDKNLNQILAPTEVISSGSVASITSSAQNGINSIFYELINTYVYNGLPNNHIDKATCTQAGVVVVSVVVRGVGLGSKSFITNGSIYFLSSFQSTYQNTYFLIDGIKSTAANPVVVAKLAYENGGGYLSTGLPSVSINYSLCQFCYLYKDLIEAVSKVNTGVQSTAQNPQQTVNIYSQTGINLASILFGTSGIDTAEIGANLNISGGFLSAYDGHKTTEQNFFLWPDAVTAATQTDPAPTGTVSTSVTPTIITSVSSVAGIVPGMLISGTGITPGTTVVSVGTTTVTMSAAATGSHSAETITFTGNQSAQQYFYQVTYEWADNQGNLQRSAPSIPVSVTTSSGNSSVIIQGPYLRLTYKTNVKICIYRWSAGQQVYYQITSITSPILNSTTSDSWSFTDIQSDAQILGGNIIYTNGGVVEDVNAPASNLLTLFDDRLWLVDAEDQNLLWYSKQVIEATPVEMSDLFTFYIAPTIGAQGSTGVISALSVMDDKLIIFKKDALYYINGTGPDNTGANSQYNGPIFITSTVGCVLQNSIVFTPNGLMFQSDKGIWLLGRDLSVNYIGAPVETYTNAGVAVSALGIPGTNQVRFTMSQGITLLYDYFVGQWGTFSGIPGISSTLYQGLHTFIDSFGRVFQETPGFYLDGSNPVLMSFLTGHIQLAGLSGYQRLFEIQLVAQYQSPHLLDVLLGYDFGPLSEQAIIQPTNFTGVYGSDSIYGQTTPYGGPGRLEQWRIQQSTQKCQAFQMSLQEIYNPAFSTLAGAGLVLSTMTCTVGVNRSYRPVRATNTVGTT